MGLVSVIKLEKKLAYQIENKNTKRPVKTEILKLVKMCVKKRLIVENDRVKKRIIN